MPPINNNIRTLLLSTLPKPRDSINVVSNSSQLEINQEKLVDSINKLAQQIADQNADQKAILGELTKQRSPVPFPGNLPPPPLGYFPPPPPPFMPPHGYTPYSSPQGNFNHDNNSFRKTIISETIEEISKDSSTKGKETALPSTFISNHDPLKDDTIRDDSSKTADKDLETAKLFVNKFSKYYNIKPTMIFIRMRLSLILSEIFDVRLQRNWVHKHSFKGAEYVLCALIHPTYLGEDHNFISTRTYLV